MYYEAVLKHKRELVLYKRQVPFYIKYLTISKAEALKFPDMYSLKYYLL